MSGCRSSRSLQESHVGLRQEHTESMLIRERVQAQAEVSAATVTATAEQVEIVTREYDTSRPVDPVTGIPPLLRETTENRRSEQDIRQDVSAGQVSDHRVLQAGENETSLLRQEDMIQEIRPGLSVAQKILIYTGVLALFAGVVFISYKFKKRY